LPSEAFLTHSVLQDALVFAAAAAVVALVDRRERRRVVRVVLLGGLGFAIHLAAHFAADLGLGGATALDLTGRAIAAIAAVALFGTLVFDVLLPLVRMRPPRILRDLAIAAGAIAATLAVLSSGKVEVVGIVATSAVLTAVIGWALQDTLANVMGGLALQLDGSVKAGDWVTFGDTTGLVREIGWRQTTLETRNRDFLVVPNSVFMKTAVTLRGKGVAGDARRERRWIRFSVESGVAPSAVVACAQESLWRDPVAGVDAEPEPDCVFLDFGDSASHFAVRYWLTDMFQADTTDSVVRTRLWFALHRAGLPIAFPVRHVTVTPDDAHARTQEAGASRAARRAALERVSIFSPLTPEEHERLAEGMSRAPFAAGESIVLQGAVGHHLYVLTKGRAEVRVSVPGSPERAVATLEAPDFFGEMGLLTGEPRKATVVALTDAEVWRVEKADFKAILEKRPAIAGAVAELVAERDAELAAVREGLSAEARRARVERSQPLTLARIREFFGID
jgi:small-conductance mechanosensitive channel/CRP-like cAMP-binding protein